MNILSKLLSLAMLCFLLVPDNRCLFTSLAARVLNEDRPSHDDHENNKGRVGRHLPKPDGSNVHGIPKTSSSPREGASAIARGCSTYNRCRRTDKATSETPRKPEQDPLLAYHFNCTKCG